MAIIDSRENLRHQIEQAISGRRIVTVSWELESKLTLTLSGDGRPLLFADFLEARDVRIEQTQEKKSAPKVRVGSNDPSPGITTDALYDSYSVNIEIDRMELSLTCSYVEFRKGARS